MTHRFFVDHPLVPGEEMTLPAEIGRQVARALRLRAGDTITLLDGGGLAYPLELIAVTSGEAAGRLGPGEPVATEPAVAMTLYAAPLKGDHFDYTLQKATEVGVTVFVPIVTARTIVSDARVTKQTRWRRIVREAAEQSGRGRVPCLHPPLSFGAACAAIDPDGPALISWEEERERQIGAALREWTATHGRVTRASLMIGPEGGFTRAEIDVARAAGIMPVTLGRRTLRAETAAVVATALTLAALGELG